VTSRGSAAGSPQRRRRRDYAGRVADILETLAVVEARRPGDILREMRLPPVDWQFLRLVPPGPSGTAPLLDLVSALTGLKDLHTAAASSALNPQAGLLAPGAARSKAQVGDLHDVHAFAAYDDLVSEHAARDDHVAALRVLVGRP
jgi:hypothetical protein